MGFCYRDGFMKSANQRCSGCKINSYCSAACQKAAWSSHKKECEMNRILNEIQQTVEAQARRNEAAKKPRTTHCTGCSIRFTDKEDEEVEAYDECPDCGYIVCESCASDYTSGSCYCENSNFGHPYCDSAPAWYHMSSRTGKGYKGDRHPAEDFDTNPGAFEREPRVCDNCGEVRKCLKPKYL